jgi:hypothetical protein
MMLALFRGIWDMQSEVDGLFNDIVVGDLPSRRRELGLEGLAAWRFYPARVSVTAAS